MIKKIHISVALLVLLGLLGAACGGKKTDTASPTPSPVATNTVASKDFVFAPKDIVVKVGDTVTWNFTGTPHTVTAIDGSFDSKTKNAGATYTYTFAAAGSFKYYCTLHGTKDGGGMFGTVTVQ